MLCYSCLAVAQACCNEQRQLASRQHSCHSNDSSMTRVNPGAANEQSCNPVMDRSGSILSWIQTLGGANATRHGTGHAAAVKPGRSTPLTLNGTSSRTCLHYDATSYGLQHIAAWVNWHTASTPALLLDMNHTPKLTSSWHCSHRPNKHTKH